MTDTFYRVCGIAGMLMLLVHTVSALAKSPNEIFEEANAIVTAPEKVDLAPADALYEELAEQGHFAADAFSNHGNVRFRKDAPGEAVLMYRRALLLDPNHGEATQNLRFLRGRLAFLSFQEDISEIFCRSLSQRQWLTFLSLSIWALVLIPLALIILRPRSIPLKVILAFVMLGAVISIVVASYGLYQYAKWDGASRLVVTQPMTVAYTAPVTTASQVIALPQGTELRPLRVSDSWAYVIIPGDLRGWVERSQTDALWPFDPTVIP